MIIIEILGVLLLLYLLMWLVVGVFVGIGSLLLSGADSLFSSGSKYQGYFERKRQEESDRARRIRMRLVTAVILAFLPTIAIEGAVGLPNLSNGDLLVFWGSWIGLTWGIYKLLKIIGHRLRQDSLNPNAAPHSEKLAAGKPYRRYGEDLPHEP
jgi:hypothetical protein